MKEYNLDKYDFKKYLLAELPDTRQEELIFWKKTIPMPVDLVYGLFEKRGELFSSYLHHIGAACLFAYAMKENATDWPNELSKQPTKSNIPQRADLIMLFDKYIAASRVVPMLNELSGILMITSFQVNVQILVDALCHEGRKYKRLYLPVRFRAVVSRQFPYILDHIALSNNDMFSNVVADVLKVYRMGFADAFAGMFNKMIDFIAENSGTGVTSASASSLKLVHLVQTSANGLDINYDKVSDGSLWEVYYKNSRNNYTLNAAHPFFDMVKKKAISSEQAFAMIVEELAAIEGDTFRDADLKVVQNLRQELSRQLRLKAEELQNSGHTFAKGNQ